MPARNSVRTTLFRSTKNTIGRFWRRGQLRRGPEDLHGKHGLDSRREHDSTSPVMNVMKVKSGLLLVLSIFLCAAAKAQTYKPPILASDPVHDSREAGMNIEVERTDSGAETHLKVMLTVPPTTPDVKAYTRIFFYGWLVT